MKTLETVLEPIFTESIFDDAFGIKPQLPYPKAFFGYHRNQLGYKAIIDYMNDYIGKLSEIGLDDKKAFNNTYKLNELVELLAKLQNNCLVLKSVSWEAFIDNGELHLYLVTDAVYKEVYKFLKSHIKNKISHKISRSLGMDIIVIKV